ncbi:hypothetical protein R3P38DRAFT_2814611 [Favolaschia claudopus]|uniref:Uncharacterized protein n=1 Tax=Favolaschia claudopus TaxID=2862362 RepID=A0AAV9Z2Y7_9AGAR
MFLSFASPLVHTQVTSTTQFRVNFQSLLSNDLALATLQHCFLALNGAGSTPIGPTQQDIPQEDIDKENARPIVRFERQLSLPAAAAADDAAVCTSSSQEVILWRKRKMRMGWHKFADSLDCLLASDCDEAFVGLNLGFGFHAFCVHINWLNLDFHLSGSLAVKFDRLIVTLDERVLLEVTCMIARFKMSGWVKVGRLIGGCFRPRVVDFGIHFTFYAIDQDCPTRIEDVTLEVHVSRLRIYSNNPNQPLHTLSRLIVDDGETIAIFT